MHQAPPPPSLSLASDLCLAPLSTGGKGYGQESGEDDFAAFRAWLQCYGVAGMHSLRDRQGRTVWFQVWVLCSHRQAETPKRHVWWRPGATGGQEMGSVSRPPSVTLSLKL